MQPTIDEKTPFLRPVVQGSHSPVGRSISQDDAILNYRTTPSFRVYKRRWFMLLVLCVLNFSNAMIWISFAPVADYAASFYEKTEDDIDWLSIIYMVAFFPCGFLASWVLDARGLRMGVVTGAWLNATGAAIRIISGLNVVRQHQQQFIVVMLGQALAASAQPFLLNAPTKLAANWFGDKERATANMLSSLANPCGVLVANALAPVIVKGNLDIREMLWIFAIPAFLGVTLATCGVCSSSPPVPPTLSASVATEPFVKGLKKLVRNKQYLILMGSFGLGIGLFTALTTLIQQVICPYGYDDKMAGTTGAVLIAVGLMGGAVAGVYVDKTKDFVTAAKVSYAFAAIAVIALTLISQRPNMPAALVIVAGIFGFFAFALMPVCLEVGVECTYPVAEATSAGLMWMTGQLSGIVIVLVCQAVAKPKDHSRFPNAKCQSEPGASSKSSKVQDFCFGMYFMACAAVVTALVFISCFKPRYLRLEAEQRYAAEKILGYGQSARLPADGEEIVGEVN